ncbi:mechanosensitive ion channel protein [Lactonifactor longoviformis]|uniref:Small conductance mechanosensitive channel n=1 Tax=Lactonifactor longoviformis DSM 17459 TaxID=1122155 RepID=A0A1M4VF06_9CLOT|nr:mechanosensitive ion channel domain-containing protein [Lactonifactor longoviformis]POP31600.1 mechanosensitive ion channel protein [Lactonifactor longoviformis]SHE67403.1 small conductance mechanosensitive channel [Lactonifactor longoviformis DSM 17459]
MDTETVEVHKMITYFEAMLPTVINFAVKVVLALLVYFICSKIIKKLCKVLRASMEKAGIDLGVVQFVNSIARAGLYFLLIVTIAVRFGIKESSVAALLASGGVAVGLALQGGLSNFAGGVIILALKPFQVGDYIIENTGKQEGTVTKIEMFYTTLSTVDNKRIVIPNGTLTEASVVNVTAQEKRKLEFKIGISYQSDLKKAKGILERLLHEDPCIMSDQEMIVFVDELGESSVIIGFRAWVKTEEYWNTKWRLNEKVKLAFDEEDIEIPYNKLDVRVSHMEQ